MQMRWCVSFVRGRGKPELRLFRFFALAVLLCLVQAPWSWAEEAKGGVNTDVMSLPAYDLELLQNQKSAVRLGDVIRLKLPSIENGPPTHIEPADSVDLHSEGWEVDGDSVHDLSFIAIPLKPGNLTLPSLVLKNAQGVLLGRSNPFRQEVLSAIQQNDPKPTQPAALEPPVGLVFPIWVVIVLGILVLIILIALGYGVQRYLKLRKARIPDLGPPPVREDDAAFQALAELAEQNLISKGQFKLHYFRVSEILKDYVGKRYSLDALESTTQEMMHLLESKKDVGQMNVAHLGALFAKLDLVKFTDHHPNKEESGKMIDDARDFVLSTKRPQLTGEPPRAL